MNNFVTQLRITEVRQKMVTCFNDKLHLKIANKMRLLTVARFIFGQNKFEYKKFIE